jgi:outer membrane protein OmpA-like peptidoglycan-associated protein
MEKMKFVLGACLLLGLNACANRESLHGPLVGSIQQIDIPGYPNTTSYVDRPTVADFMRARRQGLERALSQEISSKGLTISQLRDNSIKITVPADENFDKGSATIKPAAFRTFSKIAHELAKYDHYILHVVGHADSDGSVADNQRLSDRRATAVADYLATASADVLSGSGFYGTNLSANRVRIEGRSEREPIFSNNTEAGKRKNRRVDIVVKPVIEGHEGDAFKLGNTLASK